MAALTQLQSLEMFFPWCSKLTNVSGLGEGLKALTQLQVQLAAAMEASMAEERARQERARREEAGRVEARREEGRREKEARREAKKASDAAKAAAAAVDYASQMTEEQQADWRQVMVLGYSEEEAFGALKAVGWSLDQALERLLNPTRNRRSAASFDVTKMRAECTASAWAGSSARAAAISCP